MIVFIKSKWSKIDTSNFCHCRIEWSQASKLICVLTRGPWAFKWWPEYKGLNNDFLSEGLIFAYIQCNALEGQLIKRTCNSLYPNINDHKCFIILWALLHLVVNMAYCHNFLMSFWNFDLYSYCHLQSNEHFGCKMKEIITACGHLFNAHVLGQRGFFI